MTVDWSADMEESVFTQQLDIALQDKLLDESEHLIKTHSQKFPAATQKLVCEANAKALVSLDWVIKISGAYETGQLEHVLGCQAMYKAAIKHKHWGFFMQTLELTSRRSVRVNCVQNPIRVLWTSYVLRYLDDSKDDALWLVEELGQRSKCFEIATLCLSVASAGYLGLLCDIIYTVGTLETAQSLVLPDGSKTVYKCVFKPFTSLGKQNGWKVQLPEVYEAVREDGRYPCQYLALLLAARLGKWRRVTAAVKSEGVVLLAGADEVFVRALQRRAWAAAGHVLLSVMMVKDIGESCVLMDIQYKVEVQLLPGHGALVGRFVQQCQRLKLYAPGALFAAWGRKWRLFRAQLGYLEQGVNDGANLVALEEALRNRQFRLVHNWLQRPTQRGLWPKYVDSILWEAVVNSRNPGAKALAEQLMERCQDSSILGQVLYHIILYSQGELLRKFLVKGLLPRTTDVNFALHCAVDMLGATYTAGESFQLNPRYQILLMCLAAGLSTVMMGRTDRLPMQVAIKHGLMPVIRLFYHTGVCSSSTLHSLHLEVETSDVRPKNAAQVKEFLKQVVDTPRTLHNQCCINVSQLIGCGADRRERALRLGLPVSVTRQVLFLDVLYPPTTEESMELDG